MNFILRYNLRSLSVRRWSALATSLGVAIVVAVFCYLLCFADGLRHALNVTADPRNLIVTAEGATAESNSAVTRQDAGNLSAVPHVAQLPDGRPLVSPEVVVAASVVRRGDTSGAIAGIAARGVDLELALPVHAAVKLVEGRWFRPGSNEFIVGRTAARQFTPTAIGDHINCGDYDFEIVGVFESDGSAHESELWGHVSNISDANQRIMYSSATIRLDSDDDATAEEAIARIQSSSIALRAQREAPYYASLSENARVVQSMALAIVVIMGIGAVFAAMNAMHAALSGRTRELGMLRAIGFSRRRIAMGLISESALIALTGGVLGVLAAATFIFSSGGTRDLVGTSTFTSVAFALRISPEHVAYSLLIASAIGILGGMWPALSATRIAVTDSLRVS